MSCAIKFEQHGTEAWYNSGCRCRQCKDAHATAARLRRRRNRLPMLLRRKHRAFELFRYAVRSGNDFAASQYWTRYSKAHDEIVKLTPLERVSG